MIPDFKMMEKTGFYFLIFCLNLPGILSIQRCLQDRISRYTFYSQRFKQIIQVYFLFIDVYRRISTYTFYSKMFIGEYPGILSIHRCLYENIQVYCLFIHSCSQENIQLHFLFIVVYRRISRYTFYSKMFIGEYPGILSIQRRLQENIQVYFLFKDVFRRISTYTFFTKMFIGEYPGILSIHSCLQEIIQVYFLFLDVYRRISRYKGEYSGIQKCLQIHRRMSRIKENIQV